MTAAAILEEIRPLGRESYRSVLLNHHAGEPIYGVKIEELKKIVKRIRRDYQLALDLYDTGVYDARYLAGLIADDARMTPRDLQHWVDGACLPLAGSIVAAVAAGSPHAVEMAQRWMASDRETTAVAGWATVSALVSVVPDSGLDIPWLQSLLAKVPAEIHQAPNKVRYQMNSYVIAAGSFVKELTGPALAAARSMGAVTVDMGRTACQVPDAASYIYKVEARGTIGKKRKSAKC